MGAAELGGMLAGSAGLKCDKERMGEDVKGVASKEARPGRGGCAHGVYGGGRRPC